MENIYRVFLLGLALSLTLTIAEEIYEESSKLCSECSCHESSDNKTLYINCTARQIQYVPADWPNSSENVVATFSQNDIPRLGQFPGTDSTLKLVFDHCNIRELASGLFESSINILYFDISYNEITSDQLLSDVFKGPYNATAFEPISLEYLNLAHNEIHSLHQSLFEHLPNLKYLNLEGNNFRVLDDVTTLAFASVPQLQDFNIADNRLIDVSDHALISFRNLSKLNLSNNELDFLPNSINLVRLTLEILDISNNPIRVLDDETFLGMESLIELSARNLTELERIKTNTFAPLKKLQKLDLSHNQKLRLIDEQAFLQSETLKELYLSDTKLASLTDNVLNWSTLRVLDLADNQFFCDCNLYNISTMLPDSIKRNKDGPYCKDTRTSFSLEIYTLTSDVCDVKNMDEVLSVTTQDGKSKLLRMSLVLLTVTLIVTTVIGVMLAFVRWKNWRRNQSYPFTSSTIAYDPLTPNVHL